MQFRGDIRHCQLYMRVESRKIPSLWCPVEDFFTLQPSYIFANAPVHRVCTLWIGTSMRWTPPLFWMDFGAIRFSHSKWRRSENICNLLRFSRLSKVRFSNDIGPLAILYGSRNAKNSSTGPSRAMKPETFFFMLPRSTFICNWQRADIPAVLMTDRKQNSN